MIKKDLWTKLAFHRKSCKVFAHIILFSTQFKNKTVFLLSHISNRKTISFLKYSHICELRNRPNGSKWYNSWKLLHKSHSSAYPPWILTWGFWIVVLRCRIKLSLISMRLSDNLSYTNDSRNRTIRVIKKHPISPIHTVAHKIASLIITHPEPTWNIIFLEIIYWILCGFRFHQPILHILQSYQIFLFRNIASPKEKNLIFSFTAHS